MKDPEGGSQLELQPLKGGSELERQAGPCPSYLRRTWDHRCGTIPPWARTALANLLLVFLWYGFSTAISLWNKVLLGKDHGLFGKGPFPAPFLMTGLQFLFQHVISRAVLMLGIVRRKSTEHMSWRQYLRTVVPNGVATGLDIGLSNYSLVFITLSFYVMCKSTTPIFLLTFAIAMGVEQPSWGLAAVVGVITAGLLLLVAGEAEFHLLGFVLVMTAAALAGLRWTITQALLQGKGQVAHGTALSPVEAIQQLTPVMGGTLLLLSLAHERLWVTLPASPYFESPGHTAVSMGIIVFGAVLAFAMVWAEFQLISNTSALTFMVAGTFKETVTVGAAVLFFHDEFTLVNAFGLVVLMAGVALFNWLKYQKMKQGDLQPVPCDDEDKSSSEGEEEVRSDGHSPGGRLDRERSPTRKVRRAEQRHLGSRGDEEARTVPVVGLGPGQGPWPSRSATP